MKLTFSKHVYLQQIYIFSDMQWVLNSFKPITSYITTLLYFLYLGNFPFSHSITSRAHDVLLQLDAHLINVSPVLSKHPGVAKPLLLLSTPSSGQVQSVVCTVLGIHLRTPHSCQPALDTWKWKHSHRSWLSWTICKHSLQCWWKMKPKYQIKASSLIPVLGLTAPNSCGKF